MGRDVPAVLVAMVGRREDAEEAEEEGETMIEDQPPPKAGQTVVWPHVIRDIEERVEKGRERYGTELMTRNGRDPLIDAYQEALDLVLYLRQAILERSGQ